ncbi:MAG TPA: NAD-dependent epimerase/dehydratase family protein [Leptospiraceae bacterium]|nr:NAD-dependent epimerase/dehydratase family protein [Leptospiraceae bacterium]HMW58471.1 NAD-dependent epimerase/dehydratase family protein [Leptospiraceae bacterium]HMX56281.1 NAD-dependent epimerase/dehydratase family protein [Leptospiraceae bacterium]HMZ35926.1 NAD-dependent epimerase/dehydratase family protein [Leptospiraceae bacterium]HNE22308.1 NAD-dependent epimerase/dehydratase family protein [Leptospiraceae bacterium]
MITGASGFIGSRACSFFRNAGYLVRAHSRSPIPDQDVVVGDLQTEDAIEGACKDVDGIFHIAGLAHSRGVDEGALERVNVRWTRELANAAKRRSVPFLFISSSKVYGETGHFSEASPLNPQDAYSRAKVRAEDEIQKATDRFVILRPPPVYGVGSKGSLRFLIRAVQKGWPLPVGSIRSLRSYVFVDNLLSAAEMFLRSERSGIWNVTDDEDVSLADLAHRIARASRSSDFSFRFPLFPLRVMGILRPGMYDKVAGEFTLDIGRLKACGYEPSFSVNEGLRIACS